jgi:uncharacterized protein (UPF0248 family)
MASADVAAARKKIRAWEAGVREKKCAGRKVRAQFVQREIVLQQDLKPDVLVEGPSASGKDELEARMKKTGESFRKVKGSNPAQVRKQFLLHVMGGEPEKSDLSESKLRPPRDVLSRLKHDARYRVEEYVVGYMDRKAGMLEKSVADWQEYQEQELIAYFKHVPANEIVWDRASKVDLVFNPRSG